MPSLGELQRNFARAVVEPAPEAAVSSVVPDGLSPHDRIQVYRNNIHVSLCEALQAIFPAVRCLVGEDFFRAVAQRYIRSHPSAEGNLHRFGEGLAGFLEGFAPARALVYLPDVARLEWTCHEVFHAAGHPPLEPSRLAAVPPADYGRLRFVLHPASRLLDSPYPTLRIWETNRSDGAESETIDLGAGRDRLLVIRRDLEVTVERLSKGELELLRQLGRGVALEPAFEAASSQAPELDLGACLRRHVAGSVIVDFAV